MRPGSPFLGIRQVEPCSFDHNHLFSFLFFFFQAEDGIRDLYVTGVQTCALPILRPSPLAAAVATALATVAVARRVLAGRRRRRCGNRLQPGRPALRSPHGRGGSAPILRWTGTRRRETPASSPSRTPASSVPPHVADRCVMTTTSREGGAASRPVLPTRTRSLFLALVSLLATVPAIGLVVTAGSEAEAHGTPMKPGSRTFLYRQDALTGTGEIKPVNPACTAAARAGGATPFSDRFSVPRSDGAVRIRRFVPDGQLCGGGNTRFTGFDTPGADRP